MDISLDLYRVFASVARRGSLTAAAGELYISQPAVSQAIHRLEENLDTKLFDRTSRGVVLTQQGEILLGYVTSALGLVAAGESKVHKLSSLKEGELRIGASDTVTQGFLLPAIGRFHARFPDVGLSIINRTSRDIVQLVRGGSVDIGFVNMPLQEEGLQFEECLLVHDIFVAGEAYQRQLAHRVLTLSELVEYPLIMLEQASNSRCHVDHFFRQHGILLNPGIELGSHNLLPDFARIGLGIAGVIREFTNMEGLFEVRTETTLPARAVGVCMLADVTLPESARRFIDLVRDAH